MKLLWSRCFGLDVLYTAKRNTRMPRKRSRKLLTGEKLLSGLFIKLLLTGLIGLNVLYTTRRNKRMQRQYFSKYTKGSTADLGSLALGD
jgi:hypothetical protein